MGRARSDARGVMTTLEIPKRADGLEFGTAVLASSVCCGMNVVRCRENFSALASVPGAARLDCRTCHARVCPVAGSLPRHPNAAPSLTGWPVSAAIRRRGDFMEEAIVTNTPADANEPKQLLTAYTELCNSYHAIDDFRTKLLGFLPLVTGGGLVLLSARAEGVRKEFFGPVGRFGILVTLGLLAYELFGIKKCHALIQTGQALEQKMNLPASRLGKPGQFIRRPNNLLWVVN